MMKIILTAAFALGFATAALASDDVMASRYGNTTMVTDSKGQVMKIWYKADHTFTGTGEMALKGTWKVESGKVCLTYDTPPKMADGTTTPNPFCAPVQERKVGDKWTVGEGVNKLSIELVAGQK